MRRPPFCAVHTARLNKIKVNANKTPSTRTPFTPCTACRLRRARVDVSAPAFHLRAKHIPNYSRRSCVPVRVLATIIRFAPLCPRPIPANKGQARFIRGTCSPRIRACRRALIIVVYPSRLKCYPLKISCNTRLASPAWKAKRKAYAESRARV